jgi:hypothetical protein
VYQYKGKLRGEADPWNQPEPEPKPVTNLLPCGTVAAYRRHIRNGEEACEDCLTAINPARMCGTNAGYQKHHRNNETPCEPCRLARNKYMAQRRGTRFTGQRKGTPEHGTYSGAKHHERNKTPLCQPCRDARNAYRRQHRAQQAA